MTDNEKRYIDCHIDILTDREKKHYEAMTPVWCEDIKRVMCPEELTEVIKLRISQRLVSKETKRRRVSKH